MTIHQYNPWKGVVPYSDNADDLKFHPFRGRDKAINELLSVISNNEITTLYGRSGIGKTSLLNAGVFPKLREIGCWPVSIRLYNDCTSGHYSKHIVECLNPISKNSREFDVNSDNLAPHYLWHFFSNHEFRLNDNEVVPIIVLDQFEEILRNSPDEALLLLRQIRDAKQEGFREDGSSYEVNFRFVISIREDDLYLLENTLDTNYIDKMKTGRYRLQPVDHDSAYEIVFIKEDLFGNVSQEEKTKIADKLISMTTQDGAISSIMLSLVCSMAYNASTNGIITLDVINKLGDMPLVTFYKECISGLPKDFVDYFEETFVDYDRRRSVPKDRIPPDYLDYINILADEKSEHHILTVASDNVSNIQSYELLHDKLADSISKYHDERLTEYIISHRKQQLLLAVKYSIVSLFVFFLLYGIALLSCRPVNFSESGDLNGKPVKVFSRGYYVKGKVLKLTNCIIPEYTFWGNKEVRRVELDGVQYQYKSIYLPNADTLVIGPGQWEHGIVPASFPQIKTVIAERPSVRVYNYETIPSLDSVIIAPEDSDFLVWDSKTKTLFARNNSDIPFEAYLTRHTKPYSSIDINCNCDSIQDFDLSYKYTALSGNKKIRLINSDTTIHTLKHNDIPSVIIDQIKLIDLQYIDTLYDSAFYNPTAYDIMEASFPNVKFVGKNVFNNMNIEGIISLPKAQIISDSAFYRSNFDSIHLLSVLKIGTGAFRMDRYSGSKAKKIIMPIVDSIGDYAFYNRIDKNTYLSYNNNAVFSDMYKVFGGEYYNYDAANVNEKQKESSTNNKGYHEEGTTIVIDSADIDKLIIGKYIENITVNKGLKSFSISRITNNNDRGYHIIKGNLYEGRSIIIVPNKSTVVSLPINYRVDLLEGCSIDKCKNYICLNRSDISRLNNTKDINLFVPYGQLEQFYAFNDMFKSVQELSLIKTVFYKIYYMDFDSQFKIRVLLDQIEFDDITSLLTCLFIIGLLLYIYGRFFMIIYKREILITGMIVLISYILFSPYLCGITEYVTSDEKKFYFISRLFIYLKSHDDAILLHVHYSMWPAAYFSILLCAIYLCLKIKLLKKYN